MQTKETKEQPEESKRYNGWSNYETWVVKLWLDNEEWSYRNFSQLARANKRNADPTHELVSQLKEYHEEMNPLGDKANVFADLLGAALSEVDWYEIAEAYLGDVEDEDEEEESEEEDEPEDKPCGFERPGYGRRAVAPMKLLQALKQRHAAASLDVERLYKERERRIPALWASTEQLEYHKGIRDGLADSINECEKDMKE